MSLENELEKFHRHRDEWLREHEGEFVIIKGDQVAFFESDGDAYQHGIDNYGNVEFLIRQVLKKDAVEESHALLYGLLNAPTD